MADDARSRRIHRPSASLYYTVLWYLHAQIGCRIAGSVNLCSQFFYIQSVDKYTNEENDARRLVIERFLVCVSVIDIRVDEISTCIDHAPSSYR